MSYLLCRIIEEPEEWRTFNHNAGSRLHPGNLSQIPRPRHTQLEPLSRTQEVPRGQIDLLQASVESLPNFPTRQNGPDQDIHSNQSVRGSHDHLDSDYQSNIEDNTGADFHGNVYPLASNQDQGHGANIGQTDDHQHSNMVDRENILRKSIEDFEKLKEAYQTLPQEDFYEQHEVHDSSSNIHTHQGHRYHAAEHPYDQSQGGQGHYFHPHDQGQPVHHHGYDSHYPEAHHHFRNIYQDRPYHTIGEREETEGGNVPGDHRHYYHHEHGYNGGVAGQGFQGNDLLVPGQGTNGNYGNEYTAQGTSQDQGFHSHVCDKNEPVQNRHPHVANSSSQSGSSNGRKLPQVTYRLQNISNDAQDKQRTQSSRYKEKENIAKKENTETYADNFKVRYGKEHERKSEDVSQREEEVEMDKNIEKEFMEQGTLLEVFLNSCACWV